MVAILSEWWLFLNQVHAGRKAARAWYLKIDPVWIVCMLLCVSAPRLLITSSVMWHDMDLIRLDKEVLQLLYGNFSHGCGLGIGTRRRH